MTTTANGFFDDDALSYTDPDTGQKRNLATDLRVDMEGPGLEAALKDQAVVAFRWAYLASRAELQRADFEGIESARYFAHWRYYARLLLEAEDARETMDSLQDAVVRLFSENTPLAERERLAASCFDAEIRKMMSKEEFFKFKNEVTKYGPALTNFVNRMFYLQNVTPPITYEYVIQNQNRLAQLSAIGQRVNKIFEERSFCLGHLMSRLRESRRVEELMGQLQELANRYPDRLRELVGLGK